MPKTKHYCNKCKKGCSGIGLVVVKYRGVTLKVYKDGVTCYKCFSRRLKGMVREMEKGRLIELRRGKIYVNWEMMFPEYIYRDQGGCWNRAIRLLCEWGVMSYESKGNYRIELPNDEIVKLSIYGNSVYFRYKRDAKMFGKIYMGYINRCHGEFSVVKLNRQSTK